MCTPRGPRSGVSAGHGAFAAHPFLRPRRGPAGGAGGRDASGGRRPVPGPTMRGSFPWCRLGEPPRRCSGESGQVTVLALGFTVIAILLILGTVAVTSVQLSRMRLLDAADGAALDAADAFDAGSYQRGLGGAVGISPATVRQAAHDYLARQPRGPRASWPGRWRRGPAARTARRPWSVLRRRPRCRSSAPSWPRSAGPSRSPWSPGLVPSRRDRGVPRKVRSDRRRKGSKRSRGIPACGQRHLLAPVQAPQAALECKTDITHGAGGTFHDDTA